MRKKSYCFPYIPHEYYTVFQGKQLKARAGRQTELYDSLLMKCWDINWINMGDLNVRTGGLIS